MPKAWYAALITCWTTAALPASPADEPENRSLEESLSRAWKVLATLPRDQLTMLPARFLDAYYPAGGDR